MGKKYFLLDAELENAGGDFLIQMTLKRIFLRFLIIIKHLITSL